MTEFGPYLLEAPVGTGGMGVVHRAVDRRVPRTVALKILHPALAADPTYRERFRRESALLVSAEHPHIVPVYNSGEIDNRLFLDMRYVEGDDLEDALGKRGPMPATRAVAVIDALADALDFVHDRGVLHRDIKPKNVMLAGSRYFPYLLDFGIARAETETALTQDGSVAGSLDYLAPERFLGRPASRESDLYALAAILNACLTGQTPFPGRFGLLALARAHCDDPPPQPSATYPELAPFDDVLARGMAKEVADRYRSGNELAEAANAALSRMSSGQNLLTQAWRPMAAPANASAAVTPAPHTPPVESTNVASSTGWSASSVHHAAAWVDRPPVPVPPPRSALPLAAWLLPLSALLALIGVILPWFRAEITKGSQSQQAPHPLSAWGDGGFGVLIPIGLGALSGYLVLIAIGTIRPRDPAKSMARIALIALGTGVLSLLLVLIGWIAVPDNYTFGNGASWDIVERGAEAEGASLSRGPLAGYFLVLVAAVVATIAGALMIKATRRRQPARPVGPAVSWIHEPSAGPGTPPQPPPAYVHPTMIQQQPPPGGPYPRP